MEKPHTSKEPISFAQRQTILKNILQTPQTLLPLNDRSKSQIITRGQLKAGALIETYKQKDMSEIVEDYSNTSVSTLAGVDTLLRYSPTDEDTIHMECIKLGMLWKTFIKKNPQLEGQIKNSLQP